jgi:hypothetical protein
MLASDTIGPGGIALRGFFMHVADNTKPVVPWRGLVAFGLLAVVGAMGPDITPSPYWDLGHYIPRYVLLALSVGFGLNAVRRGGRVDRLIGVAVLVVGLVMVAHIVLYCLNVMGR